jgi:hypothetical protein
MSWISEYFEAWNERDDERGRDLLARSVTPDVELVHPTFGRSRGNDALAGHIAGYQQAMPGTEVVLTSGIDAHNQIGRYTWQVVDAGGQTLVAGLDVVEFAADWRLERILPSTTTAERVPRTSAHAGIRTRSPTQSRIPRATSISSPFDRTPPMRGCAETASAP